MPWTYKEKQSYIEKPKTYIQRRETTIVLEMEDLMNFMEESIPKFRIAVKNLKTAKKVKTALTYIREIFSGAEILRHKTKKKRGQRYVTISSKKNKFIPVFLDKYITAFKRNKKMRPKHLIFTSIEKAGTSFAKKMMKPLKVLELVLLVSEISIDDTYSIIQKTNRVFLGVVKTALSALGTTIALKLLTPVFVSTATAALSTGSGLMFMSALAFPVLAGIVIGVGIGFVLNKIIEETHLTEHLDKVMEKLISDVEKTYKEIIYEYLNGLDYLESYIKFRLTNGAYY